MNDNMEWHIMTGSKGGIGKTLLTLLLLGYYLEHKQDGSILVLDLNGMNTDSTAILLYRNLIGDSHSKHLIESQDIKQQGGEQIIFQKAYSMIKKNVTGNKQQRYYIEGYPLNPFVLYNPKLFAELLTNLKLKAPDIQKDLKLDLPLKYIFIDTNYHFL
ncbi:hypothetical protein BGP_0976 [Beggiatoa sp. PS]|nr:hypothetical protein BGP_0976 [Beggiatoa sp. PS]